MLSVTSGALLPTLPCVRVASVGEQAQGLIACLKESLPIMPSPKSRITAASRDRFGESLVVPDGAAGLETLASLAEHRVCRSYLAEPVDEDLLRLVVASGLSAPSKSDLMQVDIVQVAQAENLAEIADLMPKMDWIRGAPVFLVICGNGSRLRQISTLNQTEFANDHLDAFFNPSVDAGIVLGFLLAAADAVGLGSCPISVIRDHSRRVSELLELPPLVFPVCGLTLGWPTEKSRGISARLPLSVTLHKDKHDDTRLAEEISGYDARRGRLDGWDPAAEGFRGWSEGKARMYSEPQRTDFGEFVRGKGYKLD